MRHGWFRGVVLEQKTKAGKCYCIQATAWHDRKQVLFMHTHQFGSSSGCQVKRHVKGKRMQVIHDALQTQADYADNFNAVDRNNHDRSDHTTSVCMDCW